jgi:hypothetical protein
MTLDLFLALLHCHKMKISMQLKYLIWVLCVHAFSPLRVAIKHRSVGMHLTVDRHHHSPNKLQSHVTHVASSFLLQDHSALHLAYALMRSPLMMHA